MSSKKPVSQELSPKSNDLGSILRTAPPGAWVALSQDKTRVVGTGISAKAAAYQAKLHGELSPVLVQAPTADQEAEVGVRPAARAASATS